MKKRLRIVGLVTGLVIALCFALPTGGLAIAQGEITVYDGRTTHDFYRDGDSMSVGRGTVTFSERGGRYTLTLEDIDDRIDLQVTTRMDRDLYLYISGANALDSLNVTTNSTTSVYITGTSRDSLELNSGVGISSNANTTIENIALNFNGSSGIQLSSYSSLIATNTEIDADVTGTAITAYNITLTGSELTSIASGSRNIEASGFCKISGSTVELSGGSATSNLYVTDIVNMDDSSKVTATGGRGVECGSLEMTGGTFDIAATTSSGSALKAGSIIARIGQITAITTGSGSGIDVDGEFRMPITDKDSFVRGKSGSGYAIIANSIRIDGNVFVHTPEDGMVKNADGSNRQYIADDKGNAALDATIRLYDKASINVSDLRRAMLRMDILNQHEYTQASWKAAEDKYYAAKSLLEKYDQYEKMTQSKIDRAYEALVTAMDALEKPAPAPSPTATPTPSPTPTPTPSSTAGVTSGPTVGPTGWRSGEGPNGTIWHYIQQDGTKATGWHELQRNGLTNWYYFNGGGEMQVGWQLLVRNGAENWYYFNEEGIMMAGWQKLGWQGRQDWYYLDNDGTMLTGWHLLPWGGSNSWYYLRPGGKMAVGWHRIERDSQVSWFYFKPSGKALTGWLHDNGKWYYLDTDGRMLSNTTRTINGRSYRFSASGAWQR